VGSSQNSQRTSGGTFDNSPNDKFNPDPNRPVFYGDQTWEEMMSPFFGIVVDVKADPKLSRLRGCFVFMWTNPKSFSPSHPRAFTEVSFKRSCPAFSSAAFSNLSLANLLITP
jgi:hypothetical protein